MASTVKVYVKFDGNKDTGAPAYELKITLPPKWMNGPISKITEFFVQHYNQKFPDHTLDVALLEMRNKNDIVFASNDTCSSHIHEYADVWIVPRSKVTTTSNTAKYPYAANIAAAHAAAGSSSSGNSLAASYSKWESFAKRYDDPDDYKHPNIDESLSNRIAMMHTERRAKEEEETRQKLLAEGTPEAMKQLEEMERTRKFTFDEAISVKQEKTLINRKPIEPVHYTAPVEGEKGAEKLISFMDKHSDISRKYGEIRSIDDAETYLIDHPELLREEAAGQMLLMLLDLEMEGRNNDMKQACKNYLMLRNILDLAKQLPPNSDVRQVVRPFFKEITQKEKTEELDRETYTFAAKIEARAVQKRQELAAQEEAEGEVEGDADADGEEETAAPE